MGDAKSSSEPPRNIIVSSVPAKQPKDEHVPLESAPPPTPPASQYPPPQPPENMAMAFAQQPAADMRFGQQQPFVPSNSSRAPPPPPRTQGAGLVQHPAQQGAGLLHSSGMPRSLPVFPHLPSRQPSQQPRFHSGPSVAAIAYQISQQVQPYQGAQEQGGQFYGASGQQQQQQSVYDTYGQHYGLYHSDASAQHSTFNPYSANYPPQYAPQSTGHSQTSLPQQWYSHQQPQYYFMQSNFMTPQLGPSQHLTVGPSIPQQQLIEGEGYRSYSMPTTSQLPVQMLPRRGSDTDAILSSGRQNLATEFENARAFGQASRGTPLTVTSAPSLGSFEHTAPPPQSRSAPGSSSLPRGPPRKPKQSGNALWVGNLPLNTNVADLKDYFSRDATDDIESVFLISKSNCAFVNYRTEAACNDALQRFHDSRFQETRLVCRLRRTSTPLATMALQPAAPASSTVASDVGEAAHAADAAPREIGVEGIAAARSPPVGPSGARGPGAANPGRDRYFIVKSLTVEDLDLSVRNGVWATQSHNEAVLNQAFETAENVYLVFSANKSGEYYGYARMASAIADKSSPASKNWIPPAAAAHASGAAHAQSDLPKAIYTPPTATAPKGRIIDDSARGTIFWEAIGDDEAMEAAQGADHEVRLGQENQDAATGAMVSNAWGKPFSVEWVSTTKVPFYRTRGLRNQWNSNREVKIARDGTELEENVGKRLLQMFHRNNPGLSTATPSVQAGAAAAATGSTTAHDQTRTSAG